MISRTLWLAGTAAVLLAGPSLAHHSFAMLDVHKTSSLEAMVKEFEWINPHVWLHVTVMGAEGRPVTWSFEAGGPGQLAVVGWTPETLKPGDAITVGFHPMRDGSYGGQLLDVTFPDGRKMCQGAACRAAAGVTGPGD